MKLLKFRPIPKERVWGGRRLESLFGRVLPRGVAIGESWEICDRADACSIVSEGDFEGECISKVLSKYGREIMGRSFDGRFPLLVKWLDCRQRLSLQVHPDSRAAAELGSEEKTEAWFFYRCEPFAKFIAGLKKNCDLKTLLAAISQSRMERCVEFFTAHDGEFVYIDGGCVHSIGAGNVVLEIQKNSDTTYRIYDWNRPDTNGNLRKLHLDESAVSVDFDKYALPENVLRRSGVLCRDKNFTIRKIDVCAGDFLRLDGCVSPRILSVVRGGFVSDGVSLNLSENSLLPFTESLELYAPADSSLIITENF